MAGLLTVETRSGQPIQAHGMRLVLFSQVLHIRLPFAKGGLIWNRPVSLLVVQADGNEKVLAVQDPTRLIVWTLLGTSFLAWLMTIFIQSRSRKSTNK
jgi:hypothetical protein